MRLAEMGIGRYAASLVAAGQPLPGRSLADLIKGTDAHVGTPDDMIASLKADRTLDRVTEIAFQVHSVDPPHPAILRSIELVATDVAPAFGWKPETAYRSNTSPHRPTLQNGPIVLADGEPSTHAGTAEAQVFE